MWAVSLSTLSEPFVQAASMELDKARSALAVRKRTVNASNDVVTNDTVFHALKVQRHVLVVSLECFDN